ncbi:hypothetical protein GALMADRAFT_686739 [Galerina marginata CBS 339.88]|uniref:Uncharacterized protein n=1 Tax=Galerina marginata (strain CBS 339.88) TaxID=685588 RepID=A0A067TNT0_GALM3|nr:hypothetical protein GALMADRAFT_686739 [Galerina marginata CBS 339.88]
MPVTTASAAFHITPVVVKTFLVHGKKKAKRIKTASPEESPQDDLVFDEAFHIVKGTLLNPFKHSRIPTFLHLTGLPSVRSPFHSQVATARPTRL